MEQVVKIGAGEVEDMLIPDDSEMQLKGGLKGFEKIKVVNNNSPLDKDEQLGGESVEDFHSQGAFRSEADWKRNHGINGCEERKKVMFGTSLKE